MSNRSDIRAIDNFRLNLKSIHDLMRFDELVLSFILDPLRRLRDRQKNAKIATRFRPDGLITILENIQRNESLRTYYEVMYNQCLVLLVSYFGSAVRELFVDAAAAAISAGSNPALLDAELKISPRDLRENGLDASRVLAEAIADPKEISFQDMQSINRAFGKYFGTAAQKDVKLHNIITGQACRNAIVHNGAVVDRRLLIQLQAVVPRTIKSELYEGSALRFSKEEITTIAKEMLRYLRETAEFIEKNGTQIIRSRR